MPRSGSGSPAGAAERASTRHQGGTAAGRRIRVAVVSDIHGNLTALEAVIADLERRAPDLVIHGGDLALLGAVGRTGPDATLATHAPARAPALTDDLSRQHAELRLRASGT